MILPSARRLPALTALFSLGSLALVATVAVLSARSPMLLLACAAILAIALGWASRLLMLSPEGIAFDFCALYLGLLLFSAPMFQSASFASRGGKLDQALLLLGFAWIVVRGIDFYELVRSSGVLLSLIAFWCTTILTGVASILTITGADAGLIAAAVWGQTRPVLVMVVFGTAFARMTARNRMRLLNVAFLLGGAAIAVGFAQYSGWERVIEATTSLYTRKAEQQAVIEAMASVGRAYATFDGQPNAFGTFCMILFLMALAATVTARSSRNGWGYALMSIASAYGAAISWSRGAVAGGLAGAAVLLVMVPLRLAMRSVAILGIAVIALSQALPEETLHRLGDLITLTAENGERIYDTRLPFWSSNFEFWSRHPLLGGSGVRLAPADSQYLGLLMSGGVLGFVVFLLAIALVAKKALKVGRDVHHPLQCLAIGVTSAIAAMLVNGISVPAFMEERVMEFFWFLVALVITPLPSAAGSDATIA